MSRASATRLQAWAVTSLMVLTLSGQVRTAAAQTASPQSGPEAPTSTRLFFGPTGRSLPKGQGYVGVYEFLLPHVQVGITDRLSIGAGTPLLFFGDDPLPLWVTPKFQVYKGPKTSASIGVMHFLVFGEDVRTGLAYAVATRGTDDNAVTGGVGWAYARYHEDHRGPCTLVSGLPVCPATTRTTESVGSPVAMLGGERRVSRRVKLITENYVFEAGGIVSGGVRVMGERLSADFGVFLPLGADDFVVAPVINFVWTFGK